MKPIRRIDLRWPALVGGVAYAVAVTLIGTQADTDPVGARYASFNRVLSIALVVLTLSALMIRSRFVRTGLPGRRAVTAVTIGIALMALGSLVEFWGALAAGQPTSAMAERPGAGDAFAGGDIGFGIFVAGNLVTLVALIALCVITRRASRTIAIAAATAGLANFIAGWLWAVSPLAAAVPGIIFAFAWLAFAAAVDSPEVSRTRRGAEGSSGSSATSTA